MRFLFIGFVFNFYIFRKDGDILMDFCGKQHIKQGFSRQ
jgi:hypothetical protein